MRPEDLFRVERVGAISWSPDGKRAAIEIHRRGRWLDPSIPTAHIHLLDLTSGTFRTISPSSPAFVGFFGARWSPDGRRLAFLSVDTNAVVRPWISSIGGRAPTMLRGLELSDAIADRPVIMWSDSDHVVVMVRESPQRTAGPLYSQIVRGRNVAEDWRRARAARVAAVTMLDSPGRDSVASPSRIVSVNVRTGGIRTLARGAVHRPRLSADGRTLTYLSESPAFAAAQVASFFGSEARGDAAYARVNWGNSIHHVDARTGAPMPPPDTAVAKPPVPADARLRVTNDSSIGTRLWLVRSGHADTVIWRGNEWVRDVAVGRSEPITYAALDGKQLTGWLLYPPGHVAGRAIPIVTQVYPGTIYGRQVPEDFSLFNQDFEHPQMLAALGYGVLLPSMPAPAKPMEARGMDSLPSGVLPLLDTLVARAIADPARIAVMGQSAGGHATLGLITLTNRFRSAIASASYSNLTSLYGTFYGQFRYGDSGDPQRAQVLRMLQFERGYYGAGAPPWEDPERYRVNSPIERVANVRTPVMLIHGELDFIPVQQAEEFFTALYRQDKRVRLLRYAGEGHTIAARANVLDMWRRIEEWLRETMPPGDGAIGQPR
jgi:dipeptidyl aminopeptidase/acylaminoacyl peptidase